MIHYLWFNIRDSSFIIHDSSFIIHDSSFMIHDLSPVLAIEGTPFTIITVIVMHFASFIIYLSSFIIPSQPHPDVPHPYPQTCWCSDTYRLLPEAIHRNWADYKDGAPKVAGGLKYRQAPKGRMTTL